MYTIGNVRILQPNQNTLTKRKDFLQLYVHTRMTDSLKLSVSVCAASPKRELNIRVFVTT